jgi:dienelactone hydrolase
MGIETMKNNSVSRRRFLMQSGALAAAVAGSLRTEPAGGAEPAWPRLDRTNLLIYRDRQGEIRPVRSADDWWKRRAMIVAAMEELMGPLPGADKRCPLELEIHFELDEGDVLQQRISYAAEPGERVPGYLLIPKAALQAGAAPRPAALCPLGTGMSQTAFTEQALAGAGLPPFDDQRNYPRELAARGYVVLIPPYPILGQYNPDLKALGYESGTMKAIWNNIRALDVLESLPMVRGGRFGSIGHSLGGHNSVYTAVFEPRIAVVVSSCGLDSYLDYYGGQERVWTAGQGWTQDRYIPKLAAFRGRLEQIPFDFHEMIAALAPRTCFINAPLRDHNFQWESAAAVVRAARQVYELYGASDQLRIEHPDAAHEFPEAMRHIAYQLFDQVLHSE